MNCPPPTRRPLQLPFVFLNAAVTADGKLAFADGSFEPFGSKRDHDLLLELRVRADAVMTGALTVNQYPVTLSPGPARYRRQRRSQGRAEYNLRVVVSGSGSVNPKAELFRHHFSPIIILTTDRISSARSKRLRDQGAVVEVCGEREINFRYALAWLKRKWHVNHLLCEGGGTLNDALLGAGLVQEINLTLCPFIFGGASSPTLADGSGVSLLRLAHPFRLKSLQRHGQELYLTFLATERGRSERNLPSS